VRVGSWNGAVIMHWLVDTWRARRAYRRTSPPDPLAELIIWTVNTMLLIIILSVCFGG